jgi:hypothetical protein
LPPTPQKSQPILTSSPHPAGQGADFAELRDEMAFLLSLVLGALRPDIDARADHRALELGESARDLKYELVRRRRGVDRLLI